MFALKIFCLIILILSNISVNGGIIGYGICQTGCNALVVSCYAAAGCVFGTVTAGTGVPAAIIACNAGLGACMAGCVTAGVLSGPI